MHRDSSTVTQTSAAELADGRAVDLISGGSSGRLQLIWRNGAEYHSAETINIDERTFVPLALDPGIQRAIPLPTQAVDYGTTEALFAQSVEILTGHGLPQTVATPAIHCAFASWFPETGAPCLTITGPVAEATLLLQLLGCLVRRGLLVTEIDSPGFRGLIGAVHSTVLVDARILTRRSLAKLSAISGPRAYVPWKTSIVDFSFARVIYLGVTPTVDFVPDFSLQVNLSPSRRALRLLEEREREQIIAEFQSRFLDYRLRNLERVRESRLDLVDFDSEGTILGRMLGGCIVDAPEIQTGVRLILENRQAQLRDARWTNLTCVIIEALLDACHGAGCERIYVGDITKLAAAILAGRGDSGELNARRVGPILRRLNFAMDRDSGGYYFRPTPQIVQAIHRLACDFRVAAVENGYTRCAICTETFGNIPNPRGIV